MSPAGSSRHPGATPRRADGRCVAVHAGWFDLFNLPMMNQPTAKEDAVARRGRPSRAAIHERLAPEVEELRARLGGLPLPAEAEDSWTQIWYQEAHGSTAIEGNTLVLREVEVLLRDGRAVGQKQLKDY